MVRLGIAGMGVSCALILFIGDRDAVGVPVTGPDMIFDGEQYALGWRTRGGPRRWQVNRFASLDHAAAVARGLVRSDGGGRWRVYSTRLVVADSGAARSVLDRLLAEGVARRFAPDPAWPDSD